MAISQLTIVAYLLCIYWPGNDPFVLIHDNLDSNVIWFKLLGQSGANYFRAGIEIPNLTNGLPIVSLSNGVSFGELAHLFCGTLQAIVLNEAVSRCVALWGMFLLLRRHLLKDQPLISAGVALCYALLPFWPAGFLSVSGQPLVIYAFLNLRRGEGRWTDWTILALVPLYSSLVLAGFAIAFLFLAFVLVDIIVSHRLRFQSLAGLGIYCVFSLAASYRLVIATFVEGAFVSHRSEFQAKTYSLQALADLVTNNFLKGQYHAASLHDFFILATVAVAIVCLLLWRQKPRSPQLWWGLFSCLTISVFYGTWKYYKPSLPDHLLLQGFQWERLHFLHPLLWHLVFAFSLSEILTKARRFRRLAAAFALLMICGQAGYAVLNCDSLKEKNHSGLTFAEFFSEPLFEEIDKFIARPKESYRVASLGLHPSISQFNGYYTLDGYLANYPLEYKHSFREIIAAELAKSPRLKRAFDDWGSRCYLYSAEIGYSFLNQKDSSLVLRNLQIDVGKFREMGGGYIFSAVPVLNDDANGLSLRKVFERDDSPWRIWLYEVVQSGGASA